MIDSGDTAWVLISAALVLLMTPGLAFFYGGLVRSNQVLNTIKMSFASLGVSAVLWALLGYGIAFGTGNGLFGGGQWLGLAGVGMEPNPAYAGTTPHFAFVVFQMMFAIITPSLISGAVVGRMRFKAYILFIAAWQLAVYAPLAHWVWGPGGWIAGMGALDFAGGTVVHVSAGVAALVAAAFVGRRRNADESSETPAHNIPFVVLGASLLWFGFNAGSALGANGVAALAVLTTMLAAAAAVLTWILIDLFRTGKPSISGAAIAAVVGLVVITPAAGFVSPASAIVMGAIGSVASYCTIALIRRSKLDDTLDVFACHGVGGIVGSVLTGVFASKAVNPAGADGLIAGSASLLWVQILSVAAAAIFAAGGTAGILWAVRLVMPLRIPGGAERAGIDVAEHNERAYSATWLGLFEDPALSQNTRDHHETSDNSFGRARPQMETMS